MRSDFAVFILTHGRAKNVKTIDTLRGCGYTGKIYLIVDDEDSQINEYTEIKEAETIVFNKAEQIYETDTIDNFKKRNAVVYARNQCHDIANDLGLTYFLELDDDYKDFEFRYESMYEYGLLTKSCRNLDKVIDVFIKFLDVSGAVTVAMAQGGDMIGGALSGNWKKQILRKAMNSFFCRTDRPFKFIGSINEDVNAYTTLSQQGKLFFTIIPFMLVQTRTQENSGGLTDIYLDLGTYIKSFYTVICSPSCTKIITMGDKHRRIHHKIISENCYPKIISDKYKRGEENGK